jgi:inward rectifier potassium channel
LFAIYPPAILSWRPPLHFRRRFMFNRDMAKRPTRPPRARRPHTKIRTTGMGGSGGIRLIYEGDPNWRDLYHRLFTITWPQFFGLVGGIYVVFNLIFAAIYLIDPRGIAHARPGSFGDAFFFSVQTMATVGFGDMHPADLFTNIVVTIEVLLGITTIAIATALIFSRFSRPTARVMFSDIAVVSPYDGVPTLMFRAANRRRNQILEAQAVCRCCATSAARKVSRCGAFTTSRWPAPATPASR